MDISFTHAYLNYVISNYLDLFISILYILMQYYASVTEDTFFIDIEFFLMSYFILKSFD